MPTACSPRKRPETPVRFLTAAEAHDTIFKECATKEKTREYVRQLKLHGYNMTRLHYFDEMLMRDAKEPLQFNAEVLDRFDYYVHCLKQEGIYLNMDVMSSPVGYTPGYAWAPDPQGRSSTSTSTSMKECAATGQRGRKNSSPMSIPTPAKVWSTIRCWRC